MVLSNISSLFFLPSRAQYCSGYHCHYFPHEISSEADLQQLHVGSRSVLTNHSYPILLTTMITSETGTWPSSSQSDVIRDVCRELQRSFLILLRVMERQFLLSYWEWTRECVTLMAAGSSHKHSRVTNLGKSQYYAQWSRGTKRTWDLEYIIESLNQPSASGPPVMQISKCSSCLNELRVGFSVVCSNWLISPWAITSLIHLGVSVDATLCCLVLSSPGSTSLTPSTIPYMKCLGVIQYFGGSLLSIRKLVLSQFT